MDRNCEYKIVEGDNFSITVNGWSSHDGWHWNVYVILHPEHPRYNDDLEDLPFHGGVTYDERQTSIAFEPKYEFQTLKEWRKVGSDYAHLYDDFTGYSIDDGMPARVLGDANALHEAMLPPL